MTYPGPFSRLILASSLVLSACMALATRPAPAFAQTPPPQAAQPAPAAAGPDESPVVQELLVIGRPLGPALWRVTRGGSQVVILGGLSPIPHSLKWEPLRVQHALQGARVLFVPPDKPHFNLLDAASMLLRQGALKPPHGMDMEATLPPDLRARVDQVSARFHLDPRRYRRWKPAVAGLIMLSDFRRGAGLSSDKPNSTVAKLARAANVRVLTVGDIRIKPLFDGAAKMTDAQNQICLRAALDDLDYEAAHAQTAARAWATGDLKTVRDNTAPSLFDGCLRQLPSLQSMIEQGTGDAVRTINAALAHPGTSVAVIDLAFLLRRNGVLDRLKAEGDQITVPSD